MTPGPPLDTFQELAVPRDIDDPALATPVAFLHALAGLIENRHFGHLRRHDAAQCPAPNQPETEPESIPDPPF